METVSESKDTAREQGSVSASDSSSDSSGIAAVAAVVQSDSTKNNQNNSVDNLFSIASRSKIRDKAPAAINRGDTIASLSLREDAQRLMKTNSTENHRTIKNNTADLVEKNILPDISVS